MTTKQWGLNPNLHVTDYDSSNTYIVRPILDSFLELVCPKYPEFFFALSSLGTQDSMLWLSDCTVYCGGEKLGTVKVRAHGSKTGEFELRLHNRRVELSLERMKGSRWSGRYRATIDHKRAAKIFKTYFRVDTPIEIIARARDNIRSSIDNTGSQRKVVLTKYRDVSNSLMSHILGNWDDYKDIAIANGLDKDLANNIVSQFIDYNNYNDTYSAIRTNTGTVVTERYGKWWIAPLNMDEWPNTCVDVEKDSLPEHLKAAVGMLKLVDNETLIPDYGYRMDEKRFYIFKEAQENEQTKN